MNTKPAIAFLLAFASLIAGTAMVFLVLDRNSHAASDTLRLFAITMLPVWTIALAATKALLGRGR